jgi:hypothetical protein
VVLLVVVGLSAPTGALGFSQSMTYSDAVNLSEQTLSWRFKDAYTNGYGQGFRCQRTSDSSFRCGVGWFIGDLDYFGKVAPYFTDEAPDGTLYWRASYNVTRLNEYCLAVKHLPKRKCVHHYRGVY